MDDLFFFSFVLFICALLQPAVKQTAHYNGHEVLMWENFCLARHYCCFSKRDILDSVYWISGRHKLNLWLLNLWVKTVSSVFFPSVFVAFFFAVNKNKRNKESFEVKLGTPEPKKCFMLYINRYSECFVQSWFQWWSCLTTVMIKPLTLEMCS